MVIVFVDSIKIIFKQKDKINFGKDESLLGIGVEKKGC